MKRTTKKTIIIFIVYIVILATCMAICTRETPEMRELRARSDVLLLQMRLLIYNNYVYDMNFDNHLTWNRGAVHSAITGNRITGFIFVQSEEAALELGFPADVIIAWPSIYTMAMLDALNNMESYLNLLEIDGQHVDMGGFAFPITVEDITYNWMAFYLEMFDNLPQSVVQTIRDYASVYEYELENDRAMRRLLFPGRLDAINELITGRDPSLVNLERINELHDTNLTTSIMPLPPFTEDDVFSNPRLITSIIDGFLIGNEWRMVEPMEILRHQLEQ